MSYCTRQRRVTAPKKMSPKKKNEDKDDEYFLSPLPSDERSKDVEVHISFRDLETYPISEFFDEFEDAADLMKWSQVERLIYAKRLLGGTAKLFLRSMGRVKDYPTLKKALREEFGPKLNSAMIHKKLTARKMKHDESYQQYFLAMKEIALHGKIEEAALIEYVIDGIRDSESNKVILYGAADMKEFRKKLDIYSEFRKKITSRPNTMSHTTNQINKKPTNVKRCFNCGDLDHQTPTCTKGIKCFRCTEFGHKSNECTKALKKIQNKDNEEKIPYEPVKIGGVDMVCLIDTDSDVNLVTEVKFKEVVQDCNDDAVIRLTEIAGKDIYTNEIDAIEIQIDNEYDDKEPMTSKESVEIVEIEVMAVKPFEIKEITTDDDQSEKEETTDEGNEILGHECDTKKEILNKEDEEFNFREDNQKEECLQLKRGITRTENKKGHLKKRGKNNMTRKDNKNSEKNEVKRYSKTRKKLRVREGRRIGEL